MYILCTSFFTSITDFLFEYRNMFSAIDIVICHFNILLSCMRKGMLTISGIPSTTSHLDIYILSIFHNLGSPLG